MGSKAVFFFFMVYIAIRFRGIKLGHKDEPPEFDSASYFMMIFAAGVAVGLFVSRRNEQSRTGSCLLTLYPSLPHLGVWRERAHVP